MPLQPSLFACKPPGQAMFKPMAWRASCPSHVTEIELAAAQATMPRDQSGKHVAASCQRSISRLSSLRLAGTCREGPYTWAPAMPSFSFAPARHHAAHPFLTKRFRPAVDVECSANSCQLAVKTTKEHVLCQDPHADPDAVTCATKWSSYTTDRCA